jgi:hypothetical protein
MLTAAGRPLLKRSKRFTKRPIRIKGRPKLTDLCPFAGEFPVQKSHSGGPCSGPPRENREIPLLGALPVRCIPFLFLYFRVLPRCEMPRENPHPQAQKKSPKRCVTCDRISILTVVVFVLRVVGLQVDDPQNSAGYGPHACSDAHREEVRASRVRVWGQHLWLGASHANR